MMVAPHFVDVVDGTIYLAVRLGVNSGPKHLDPGGDRVHDGRPVCGSYIRARIVKWAGVTLAKLLSACWSSSLVRKLEILLQGVPKPLSCYAYFMTIHPVPPSLWASWNRNRRTVRRDNYQWDVQASIQIAGPSPSLP